MATENLRRQFLINACPTAISGAVGDLLHLIRAPAGAEMLHQAISGVEEALDSVTEEIRHETLNRYRRAAVACLKQIGRIPGFTDDSYTDYEAFPADATVRPIRGQYFYQVVSWCKPQRMLF